MTDTESLIKRINDLDDKVSEILVLFIKQQAQYADLNKTIENKICDIAGVQDVRSARELFSFMGIFKTNSCRAVTIAMGAAVTGIAAGIISLFVAGLNSLGKVG